MLRASFILSAVILIVALVEPSKAELQCYFGSSYDSGEFPAETINKTTCPDGSYCYKQQFYESNDLTKALKFSWGCYTPMWPTMNYDKCGETMEESLGARISSAPDSDWAWLEMCSCCGEFCNNQDLNSRCNKVPKFIGTCQGLTGPWRDNHNPIPDLTKVVTIGITANEICYKRSLVDTKGEIIYEWGGVTLAEGYVCGDTIFSPKEDPEPARICTCCSNNCNDVRMNNITINTDCLGVWNAAGLLTNSITLLSSLVLAFPLSFLLRF